MKKDTAERTYIVFRISFSCLLINKITLNFFKFFSKNVLTFGERYSILCLVVKTCASGSVGGARPCQGRGRGFESRLALIFIVPIYGGFFASITRWIIKPDKGYPSCQAGNSLCVYSPSYSSIVNPLAQACPYGAGIDYPAHTTSLHWSLSMQNAVFMAFRARSISS